MHCTMHAYAKSVKRAKKGWLMARVRSEEEQVMNSMTIPNFAFLWNSGVEKIVL